MIHSLTKRDLLISSLPYLLLFMVLCVCFTFFVDYIFFYQEKSALFVLSYDYLYEYLRQPGSLLIYIGNFLTTFYYYPILGSVIVSVIIILIVFIASEILYSLAGRKSKFIPFLIGGLLFCLQTNYLYFIYNSLGLLLQLLFFLLAVKHLRSWLPVIVSPLWYFVTGGYAWIFFLIFTLHLALNTEKTGWIKIASIWILNLLVIYFCKEFLFFQSLEKLLIFPFLKINIGSQSGLFLIVVVILSTLPLIAKLTIKFYEKIKFPKLLVSLGIPLFLISISVIAVITRIDVKSKQYFHVEKLFYQNKPEEIISYNLKNSSNNKLTSYLNNIALCETGKLNDLLFHFPQSLDNNTLFLKWEPVEEIVKRGGYFYYSIGMINEAHRWFYEYMVMKGNTPENLKMLIKTDLIYGNYATAAKYVSVLKKSIFYKKEANEFEKLLFNETSINSHPQLGEKRKRILKEDFFVATGDPIINLFNALVADSLNKDALEYELAFFLLKKDFLSIVKELPKLEILGFKKLPVHVEEAVAVYKALPDSKFTNPGNLGISKDTELRFSKFYQIFQQFGNDRKAAKATLKKNFGNTFWYYVMYY